MQQKTYIIAKVDINLVIPPNFKNFNNKTELKIELIANTPKELPEHIVDYYVKNRPKVFSKKIEVIEEASNSKELAENIVKDEKIEKVDLNYHFKNARKKKT